MGWSVALAVVGVATTAQTPQAAAIASDEVLGGAVRHLGLEAAGHFRFELQPGMASTVALLAAVAYPLADPAMYNLWLGVEQAVGMSPLLPDPGSGLVAALRDCEQAGDGVSVALHLAASCLVGPFWEETFWRGFFLASMTRVLPLPACVALSSASFAALHLGPGNLLPIAALSATCDLLYLRTASLAAPLAFHAGWNAYQLAGILLLGKEAFV
ncbi:hypothetical protein GPECTOR_6g664 [Gonium pectorale]|uniref:CAAX prenyl protease 2/Lysostaphin resistance protein A-like domain-containing protein n=1 Tax=Gonium pectorale TaxID=33097 RepID=A0A150GV39_GONPE|nr:hypothetical protein GPECTOR_6g664 [Gonium pectorale]|eukprot:KXZ53747.1 hypothetical protein GPECTOR_6g664 [Gonium pectorale]